MSDLPQGWAVARLGEMLDVLSGYAFKSTEYCETGHFLIRIGNVQDDFITNDNPKFVQLSPSTKRFELKYGDILTSLTGNIGRVARIQNSQLPAALNQRVAKLTLNTVEIDTSYVYIFLSSSEFRSRLSAKGQGAAQQNVSPKEILDISLNVAPLPEQRRIVAKIDSLAGKSRRARGHLDHIPRLVEKYKQAILAAAFRGDLTREWRRLNGIKFDYRRERVADLAKVVTGSTPPTKQKEKYFGGDIPFVKPTDLDAGYFVSKARETLTEAGLAASRTVSAGSTLVTCIGATIAKTGFARIDCCTNQQINALIPDRRKIVPEWLFWSVMSPEFRQSILDNSSATTLPIINKGRFQELTIPSVPQEEQVEIVRCIEAAFGWIDRLSADVTSGRKLIERLDQTILAKAFKGELVPQDPADEPASVLLDRIRAERGAAPKAKRGRKKAV